MKDSLGAVGSSATTTITYTAASYTDTTLKGVPVKALHVNELRTQVDNLRNYYGMAAVSWTDTIAPGVVVKAAHFTQLQNVIREIATLVGVSTSFTGIAKNQRITATTITQMRSVLPQL